MYQNHIPLLFYLPSLFSVNPLFISKARITTSPFFLLPRMFLLFISFFSQACLFFSFYKTFTFFVNA